MIAFHAVNAIRPTTMYSPKIGYISDLIWTSGQVKSD